MINKIFRSGLIIFTVIGLVACGRNKTNHSEKAFVETISNIEREGDSQINIDAVFQLLENYPETMDFSFDAYKDYETNPDVHLPGWLSFATSNDGKVRIYSIEMNGGVSNPNYTSYCHFIQFRHNEKVFLKSVIEYFNSGFFVDGIFSVETENQTYYLFRFTSGIFAQGSHYKQIIKAYQTDNNGHFNSKKLFKTKKENLDEIEISWDYDCIEQDIPSLRHEGCGDEIIYDSNDKKLFVPYIIAVEGGNAMTEGNLIYQWKGDHFEYTGIAPVKILETEKFRIQIDITNNGKYRYTSWSKGKRMPDKPDLIIENGIKECWCEPGIEDCNCNTTYDNGESAVLGERYIFEMGNYIYMYEDGWIKGGYVNELSVIKNGYKILTERIVE
ncbi:hypothetical protein [Dysgonomonas termitidis]|uniref:Uncharacterized protein n=1 Tax=Dysgonomonas termitidis TaxID=1516126 RepID=A0ABV9L001_9BACT